MPTVYNVLMKHLRRMVAALQGTQSPWVESPTNTSQHRRAEHRVGKAVLSFQSWI